MQTVIHAQLSLLSSTIAKMHPPSRLGFSNDSTSQLSGNRMPAFIAQVLRYLTFLQYRFNTMFLDSLVSIKTGLY